MARASWKLCSMSGLQTPSASADDKSLSSSLISPTSKCLSTPRRSTDPNGPAPLEPTGVHGEVMLAVPIKLSEREQNPKKKNPRKYINFTECLKCSWISTGCVKWCAELVFIYIIMKWYLSNCYNFNGTKETATVQTMTREKKQRHLMNAWHSFEIRNIFVCLPDLVSIYIHNNVEFVELLFHGRKSQF